MTDRLAVPARLAWMRDEALLRPVAITRVAGVPPEAFVPWAGGVWTPTDADVLLLAAFARMHDRLAARYAAADARRAW